MIARRSFLTSTAFALLAAPLAAWAQPAGKLWRIGYLSLGADVEPFRSRLAAFRQGLRKLGYMEGENIIIEQRHAAGRVERLRELAAELVRLKVDVLVTDGDALAAKKVTSTIPIVFVVEPDPVGTGLVASLAHPGANVTGLADAHADLVPKRLQLLKEVVPSASRVGVLFNPANSTTAPQLKIAQTAGPALGLTVFPVEVKGPGGEDMGRIFAMMRKERPGGLLVIGDPTLVTHRKQIGRASCRERV